MKRTLSPLSILGGLVAIAAAGLLVYGVISKNSVSSIDSTVLNGGVAVAPDQQRQLPLLNSPKLRERLSNYRGKVVLLNFWASWCEPCADEAPALEQAHLKLTANNGLVLGVNYKDSEPDAKAFVKKFKITYPNLRDTGAQLADSFNVNALPDSFLIDRQGRIVALRRGQIDQRWIDQALSKVGI